MKGTGFDRYFFCLKEEMMNSFKGRSLCVIDDFSKEERLYLFSQVRKLKQAVKEEDTRTMDSFRINDPDFGIYEVFLEDSTRTKESFRNAANFHHAKLTEMSADNSSFNRAKAMPTPSTPSADTTTGSSSSEARSRASVHTSPRSAHSMRRETTSPSHLPS